MSGGGSVDEALTQPTELAAGLALGVRTLSLDQEVTFVLYKRMVLPVDGFVFWCRADTLSRSALGNTSRFNTFQFNQPQLSVAPAPLLVAKGSLHHTTTNTQDEAESFSVNKMIFTSLVKINDLSDVAPDEMWVGTHAGHKFSFSSRNMFYQQAQLYHYAGDALYSSMATQLIDNPAQLMQNAAVVSNSLPVWLTLGSLFPVFPSYLVPDNSAPPYAAIHIGQDDTSAMQAGTYHDKTGSGWKLVKDVVRITLYGVRNDTALDFIDLVADYTLANPNVMGVMNSPVVRDAKRGQTEFSIIAQKKMITYEVDYYQRRMRDVARKLILSAFIEVFIAEEYSQQVFGVAL